MVGYAHVTVDVLSEDEVSVLWCVTEKCLYRAIEVIVLSGVDRVVYGTQNNFDHSPNLLSVAVSLVEVKVYSYESPFLCVSGW